MIFMATSNFFWISDSNPVFHSIADEKFICRQIASAVWLLKNSLQTVPPRYNSNANCPDSAVFPVSSTKENSGTSLSVIFIFIFDKIISDCNKNCARFVGLRQAS